MQQVQNTYRLVLQQYMNQITRSSHTRIRIAVLDTGYDPNAEFFVNRDRRARLRGWKDCVADSQDPGDEHGHGTRVLSLLMKMAPMADVYVARVAKNSSGLERSSESIADVGLPHLSDVSFLLTFFRRSVGLQVNAMQTSSPCRLVLPRKNLWQTEVR